MAPIFRFIAGAWIFLWRQPALLPCMALLVFVPLLVMGYLSLPFETERPEYAAVLVVLHVAAIVLLTWGIACTLTVGKRLLQAKAGRLRTSFKAVQGQARGLIVPLLLTDILRGCIAVLWGLPFAALIIVAAIIADQRGLTLFESARLYPWLIVLAILFVIPPVVYSLQTVLAPFVVAYEKLAFRPALKRSRQLTRGRLPYTLLVVVVLLLLWIPGFIAAELLLRYTDARTALIAIPPVTAFLDTFALTLWLLALTQYFKALGGKTQAPEGE